MGELRNSPRNAGPGVMDLIYRVEVWGVKAISVGVILYSAILFGYSSIGEVDGRAPVEIKKMQRAGGDLSRFVKVVDVASVRLRYKNPPAVVLEIA